MPTKLAPENARHFRFAVADHSFGVDPATGTLSNLQLMAAGREAKGHGIYIDDKTLTTAKEAVDSRGGRLKAYVTHDHAGPCSWRSAKMDEASSELNIPGFFSSIAVKKAQLVAGTFEFYDAFKANFKPQFDQLVEMARKTPDLLGISTECWGYVVYVGKDGVEYSGEPDGVELLYNGMPALRVTDLWAAAFVSDGAATDSLFAAFSSKFPSLFGGKQTNANRRELATALTQFAAEFAATESDEPTARVNAVPHSAPNGTSSEISCMKIIADLKVKITDPQRFAAAMAIVGNTPADKLASLTVGDVETQLAAGDVQTQITTLTTERDTLRGQVTTLTTERDTARGQVTSLTTDRDSWKTKYETLKTSGKGGKVDLGAGNSTATDDGPNPWAKETINYTRQAEMMKSDPVRGAALKAAAGK